MAITAWSANVVASSICLSLNGRTEVRASANTPIGAPSNAMLARRGQLEVVVVPADRPCT
jgi:hypothetical protein